MTPKGGSAHQISLHTGTYNDNLTAVRLGYTYL